MLDNLDNISEHNFEQCTKCTICTAYCPVSAVNPLYPGPKHSGPDGERLRLKGDAYFDEALKMCLNCKRCEVACPSDVKIGDIIQAARIKHSKKSPKLRDMMLANTDFMGKMVTPFAPIANVALGWKITKNVLDATLKIDRRSTFPKYSWGTFERWYNKHAAEEQKKFDKQVAFFHGCYANFNNPQLGKDLIKVMNAAGFGVQLLEKEKCCGVPLIANGLIKQATRNAKTNLKAIRKSVLKDKMPVITVSSTCTMTIRDEYPHLLGVENQDVRDEVELAVRFLYRLLQDGKLNLKFKPNLKKMRVVYHTACHMEKLGWMYYSQELLRMIPNLELIILESQCCGIAGTYGFKRENYETSRNIGSSLFKAIDDIGNSDCVTTECETCKWQIEMSTPHTVENPITILANALADKCLF